jgi:hypothetical protein
MRRFPDSELKSSSFGINLLTVSPNFLAIIGKSRVLDRLRSHHFVVRTDLANVIKLAQLHSLLPYSYRCVTVGFEYDGVSRA